MCVEVENKTVGHLLIKAIKYHSPAQHLICMIHVCVGRVSWWPDRYSTKQMGIKSTPAACLLQSCCPFSEILENKYCMDIVIHLL